MSLAIFDHLLIVGLFIALPLEGLYAIRRLIRQVKAGDTAARSRAYIGTIILQWSLVLALAIAWQVLKRPWTDLGLRSGSALGAAVGLGFLVLIAGFLRLQHSSVKRLTDEQVADFRERSSETAILLPATQKERFLFALTATTAGICEELLCRGFVFWYLDHFFNPWISLLVASTAFGIAHAYQGPKGIIRTGIVGTIFGLIYVLTGSLIFPIIGHIAIDMAALGPAKRLAAPPQPRPARDSSSPTTILTPRDTMKPDTPRPHADVR